MSQPEAAAPADAPAKKGRSKLLMIGAPVMLLLGGGGGGWWYFTQQAAAADPAAAEAAKPEVEPGIVQLEPFVVNLADSGGRRFLRVSVALIIATGEEDAKHLEENKVAVMRVRSAILELLATQTSEHLISPDGKTELKKAIAEGATHALDHVEISDVLFGEFVVQ